MNYYRFDKRVWAFIVGVSLLIPSYYQLRSLITGQTDPYYFFLSGMIFTFFVTLAITYSNFFMIKYWLNIKIPWAGDTRISAKRIAVELILTSINAVSIMVILILILDHTMKPIPDDFKPTLYFDNIILALLVNLIAMTIIEANHIYNNWKLSAINAERLKQQNISSQFDALKNQVNPHFLFNSLNVLHALIKKDPDEARSFVEKFSRIFRYVLSKDEEMVSSLSEEIEFVKTYMLLQEKRYGSNLQWEIRIAAEHLSQHLPSLALQTLVENAIKHNEISALHPLTIEVFSHNGQLVVRNNLQPRHSKELSTGIGLKNLKERYALMSDQKPEFIADGSHYTATLPLISAELIEE